MALGLLLGSSFETRCDIAVQCVASDKRTNNLMVQDFKIEKVLTVFSSLNATKSYYALDKAKLFQKATSLLSFLFT